MITGAAWLPSARVLKCQVYSWNERNLQFLFYKVYVIFWQKWFKFLVKQRLNETKITPSPHDLYILGYFHVLQGYLQRNYLKRYQSTDCFLKLENIKEESLVIVYQHGTVNMCLGLVHTARHVQKDGLIWI